MISQELQRYYEDRAVMMTSQGWRDLMEDVQKMLDASDTLAGVTADNLRFKQGEISVMQWLITLKETSEQAYEGLTNESA